MTGLSAAALRLVQAAVAGWAHSIRFEVGANDLKVQLMFSGPVNNQQTVQSYLADAFNLARDLQPTLLTWENSGTTLSFLGVPEPEPRFDLVGKSIFRFVRSTNFFEEIAGPDLSTLTSLASRCSLSPIPIFIAGSRINSPLEPGSGGKGCEAIQLASRALSLGQRFLAPTPEWLGFGVVDIDERTFRSPSCSGQGTLILEGALDPQIVTHSEPAPRGSTLAREARFVEGLTSFRVDVEQRTDWINAEHYLSLETADRPSYFAQRRVILGLGQGQSVLQPIVDGVKLDPVPLPECRPGCRVIQAPPEDLASWQKQMDAEFERLTEVWVSLM